MLRCLRAVRLDTIDTDMSRVNTPFNIYSTVVVDLSNKLWSFGRIV